MIHETERGGDAFALAMLQLGALLVVLKVIGLIDYSWVWVTMPLWGALLIAFALVAVYAPIVLLAASFQRWCTRKLNN